MKKIILVHYINVRRLSPSDVDCFMTETVKRFTPDDPNIISYWIPIRRGNTRVECINPKLVSAEDFVEAKRALDKHQSIINDLIKSHTI